jgi:hypothetical protein
MRSKITTAVFLLLLFGLAIWNLATPSREFSENENRYLQQFPAFSRERLLSGKFTSVFDSYITDQFAFRDGWVGVKAVTEQILQKHSSNGVYFAEDQHLIEMFDTVDEERYADNLGYVADFAARANVPVRTLLVPTASMILADKLPAFAPEVNQRALLDQAAATIPNFIDVSAALLRHSAEELYYRTDHHWTSRGAYYGYTSFREQLGLPARTVDNYLFEVLTTDFYGTTWSKASLYTVPPDTIVASMPRDVTNITVDYNFGEKITDTIYERSFLEVKDKYSVFLNANQSVVHIETGIANGKKLLLIKDSYANTFVQFLLSDYEEIYVVDPRYYRSSYLEFIEEYGITEALVLYNIKGFSSDANVYFLTT